MFNHIYGTILDFTTTSVVLAIESGIGFEISINERTYNKIKDISNNNERQIFLYTHLIVKEDDLRLVGFVIREDRKLFRDLIKVSGVGMVMALNIMNSFTEYEFRQAIEEQDKSKFKGIKGVGDKMVNKILLEFKGKNFAPREDDTLIKEGIIALMGLGLMRKEAQNAADMAMKQNPKTIEEFIKFALAK